MVLFTAGLRGSRGLCLLLWIVNRNVPYKTITASTSAITITTRVAMTDSTTDLL